jgi:predicted kinase
MRTAVVIKGLPGSGKSTYAKKLLCKNSSSVRVNKDDIREMLSQKRQTLEGLFNAESLCNMFFCDKFRKIENTAFISDSQKRLISLFKNNKSDFFEKIKKGKLGAIEGLTLQIEDECIRSAVENYKDVIVDDCNYHPKHIERVKKYCQGYTIKIFDVHKELGITLEQSLERNKNRSRVVPEFVIRNMAKNYGIFSEGERNTKNKRYESTNRVVVSDLDGTLACIDHRLHFLNKETNQKADWKSFFDAMKDDVVRLEIKSVLDDVYPNHDIVLVSGRPETHREATEKWLKDNGIRYNALLMRKAGDKRPDIIVKQEILDTYLDKNMIDMVIDDRKVVIDMFRSNGLKVMNVGGEDNDF